MKEKWKYISLPKEETKKKFQDPNENKRPPSNFLLSSEYWSQIKGEHPGLSAGDVAKKLGEKWNKFAANNKQSYEKKITKLKEKWKEFFCLLS
jgi:hypothetical protein